MDEPQLPQPRVAQAQAAIDAENHTAPPQEQPQAQSEVQAQPNAEPVPAPTSLLEEKDLKEISKTDLMWMKVALMVASRAEISEYAKEKPNVGCVIRRSRNKGLQAPTVLAVGWNGFPPKTSEDILKEKAAEYDRKGKKHGLTNELALHAEANALQYCSETPEKATVYITHVPCHGCAKQLVSHRVKRVFYLFWMDKSESSIALFRDFDISCIPFLNRSRDHVLSNFSKTFLEDHNICAGSTKKDIPKKGSFHLSTEDSTGGTSSQSDKVDFPRVPRVSIFQEFQEYLNQHYVKIVGVPEKSSEKTPLETSNLCVSLFTEMGAEITNRDIDTAQRTAKGGDSDGPRPIICKFVRGLARDSVMSIQQQACNVDPVKIGFSEDTDVSKISICDYDENSQGMTEGASSTQ